MTEAKGRRRDGTPSLDGREVTLELLGTNEREVAYIAGFFDGEGCVRIQEKLGRKRGGVSLRTQIVNAFPEPLRLCQRIFGGKVKLIRTRENWSDLYGWEIYARKAETFLAVILPYLILKREEATLGISFCAYRGTNSPQREILAEQIKSLKSRNRIKGAPLPGSDLIPAEPADR
ncbi:hypothetical protein ES703_79759 [subsurface metagenome]